MSETGMWKLSKDLERLLIVVILVCVIGYYQRI